MPETYGNKQVVQGEDIILLVDDKTTLHATTHTLKVDLEMKELRTKDTDGKEKWPGDVSWSVDGDGLVVVDDSIENSHTAEEVLDLVLRKKLVEVVVKSPLTGLAEDVHGQSLHHDLFALDACGRQRLLQLFAYRQRQPDAGRQT